MMLNGARNCKKYGVDFDVTPFIEALLKTKTINQIMAAEGGFKKAYYEQWNHIISNQRSFKFTTRSKRPPINSFISYVNTRIYNVCLSEIYKTELDPRIGFLHEPNYNALSLRQIIFKF